MSDFDFALVAVVPDGTRPYRIDALGVTLTVAPASEANRSYWNAALAAAGAMQGGRGLTAARVEDGREADAALLAAHVVKGWSGVLRNGQPYPFTGDNAKTFLVALAKGAPHVFDELKAFCKDEDNFTAGALSLGGLAGNS